MTEILTMILGFAVVVVASSNVLKELIKVYKPELKVGLLIACVFGLLISFGYGQGILGMLFKLDYESTMIPILFQGTDLMFSGLLYTLGSKIITDVIDLIQIKVPKK